VEEVWSSVRNAGRKPTAWAHAERNGDEHRTLASRSLCLLLTTGLERMPAWPAEADLSKTGCFISLELRNNWRSGFSGTPYAAFLAELQSNNNARRGRLSQTDCGRSVRVFFITSVCPRQWPGGGMSHFTPVSRITPAFGLSVTRCLHFTTGCTTVCVNTTGWVNYANERSQAALERSSQDADDVIRLTRAARRLCGQLTDDGR